MAYIVLMGVFSNNLGEKVENVIVIKINLVNLFFSSSLVING